MGDIHNNGECAVGSGANKYGECSWVCRVFAGAGISRERAGVYRAIFGEFAASEKMGRGEAVGFCGWNVLYFGFLGDGGTVLFLGGYRTVYDLVADRLSCEAVEPGHLPFDIHACAGVGGGACMVLVEIGTVGRGNENDIGTIRNSNLSIFVSGCNRIGDRLDKERLRI